MAEFTSQDWISAYLDGELAPSEAAEAERRLEADPVAREEWHALRDVGDLIASLPKQNLPSEFTATVLQRCERESLLPSATSTIASPAKNRPTKNWGILTASVLTTAVVLFLAARLVITPTGTPANGKTTTVASADKERGFRDNVLAESNAKQIMPDGRTPGIANTASGSTAKNFTQSPRSAPPGGGTVKNGIEKAANFGGGFDKARRVLGAPTNNAPRQPFKGIAINNSVEIGDVIPYFAISGDHTAVIELVVVDINESIGQLEVLLSAKHVGAAFQNDVKKDAALHLDVPKLADRQMIAVYVESTPLQLAAVLREIREKTKSLEIGLKPPRAFREIQLAKTSEGTKPESAKENRNKPPLTFAKAVSVARKMVATRNQNKNSAKVAGELKGTNDAPGAAATGQAATSTMAQSFRMRVTLAEQLEKPSTSTTTPQRMGTFGQPSRQGTQPSAKSKQKPRAVRVIFLFRKQAAHQPPSAAIKPGES